MTVTIYKSTDTSAPVMTGEVGALTALLRACLVIGYGEKVSAGWAESFTGTDQATFRPLLGNRYYLHVNDAGPGAGTAKEARVFGTESASAVLTGLNLFPTAAQSATGTFWRKSVTADATARPWILIADGETFYLWILSGDTANAYLAMGFGGIYSFKSSDLGRTFIQGRIAENSGTAGQETFDLNGVIGTIQGGFWLARDTQNTVGAITSGKVGDQTFYSTPSGGSAIAGTLTYKNPADNRIYLAPMRVYQTSGGVQLRGRLRGLWHFGHAITNASDGDTLTGVDSLEDKSFLIIKQGQNAGIYCVETSQTWESN